MIESPNRRVIVIDDNEIIHQDFHKLLCASADEPGIQKLVDLEASLFGDEDSGDVKSAPAESFDLTDAYQGQEGYEMVLAAAQADQPFALAFVDMRMPPGWDGLVTIEHLWKADPNLEVVICSAYSDYSWSEIDQKLGFTDQLRMIKKPFDTDSIRQIAANLTRKWNKQKTASTKEGELQLLVEDRTREIEAVRLSADKANRAKSEFLENVNHEIRTPMTVILGYAELLLANEGVKLEVAEQIEGLEMIRQNGEQLLELINEFLDLTKIEGGRLQLDAITFSPRTLCEEIFSLMKIRSDEKELPFRLEVAANVPDTMHSDSHRIRQILYILIGNAIRFTKKGKVRLSVSDGGDGEHPDSVRFDVTDSGTGISPKNIEGLFQPFANTFRATHGCFGGTGLGVSLSKQLAELLGGDIRLTSELGEGTQFSVWVPKQLAIQPQHERSRIPIDERGPLPALDCRLLWVEDVRTNQMLISMVLKKAGATVEIACNGQQAIEKIHNAAAINAPYDLILMDMQMPVLSGWEATERLRNEGYDRPIFALTARTQQADEERCIAAGCDAYFTKPLDRGRLIRAINEITKVE